MTNVNELRQRIAEIEVPKSFLKSLKRDYGHQPIKKTSIGNLLNAEPSAFERRKRNFNIYRTDDYSDTIEDRFNILGEDEIDSIITKADRKNYTEDIPKWTGGDSLKRKKNTSGPTAGLDMYADTQIHQKDYGEVAPWDASTEGGDINLTTGDRPRYDFSGEKTAILKQRLARIYYES